MQWLEVRIKTTSAGMEQTAAYLTALGYDSFIMDDVQEFHEFLEQNRQYWDYVDETLEQQMQGVSQIRLYLEDKPGVQEELALLQTHLNQFRTQHPKLPLGSLAVETTAMQDEDWENNWKQYYTPIAIGERLIVLPQWLAEETKTDRIPIILDPGMIFGTGAHASTQMCLAALERRFGAALRDGAQPGEASAQAMRDYLCGPLSGAVYSLVMTLDVELCVLAGIVPGALGMQLCTQVSEALRAALPESTPVRVEPSVSADAGVIGAAATVFERSLDALLGSG